MTEETEMFEGTAESINQLMEQMNIEPEEKEELNEQAEEQEQPEEDLQEDTEDNQEETPSSYKIVVDGEEMEVSLDDLKSGYMKNADYTRKTQQLANSRKEYDERLNKLQDMSNLFLENIKNSATIGRLQELDEVINQVNPAELDAESKIKYREILEEHSFLKSKAEKELAKHNESQRLIQAEREKQVQEIRAEEKKKLFSALPEYQDPKVLQKDQEGISTMLESLYGKEEGKKVANSILDHRGFLLLRMAKVGYEYLNKEQPKPTIKRDKLRNGNNIKNPEQGKSSRQRTLENIKKRGNGSGATRDETKALFLEEAERLLNS